MYQTYCVIIDYLLDSKKIGIDSEGKIAWIWDPAGVERFLSNPNLSWKK